MYQSRQAAHHPGSSEHRRPGEAEQVRCVPGYVLFLAQEVPGDGEEGLQHGMTAKKLRELRQLEKENRQLKELVAKKELLIRALKEARVKKN